MLDDCGCGGGNDKDLAGFKPKCEMSGTLEIFKEFNQVYKERLRETECAGGDATALKLKTLEDWVSDLTEQNTVLVETVEALEKEALFRLGIGSNTPKCGSHDDVKDCKVCQVRRGVCGVRGKVSHSSDELHSRVGVDRDAELLEALDKLKISEEEIENLKTKLADNEVKLNKINEDITASEKSAKEMRAALTTEVAEKHDQVLSLRREVQHLEDKLRQADMQTHFKDDIIKELRKEIKITNNKLHFLGADMNTFPQSNSLKDNIGDGMRKFSVTNYEPHSRSHIDDSILNNYKEENISIVKTRMSRGTSPHRSVNSKQNILFKKQSVNLGLSKDENPGRVLLKEDGKRVALSNNDLYRKITGHSSSKRLHRRKIVTQTMAEKHNNVLVENSCGDYIERKNVCNKNINH